MGRPSVKPDLPMFDCPVPASHSAPRRKREIRRNGSGGAFEAIGPITPDTELFVLTNGQFSMIDIVEHVINYTGPAELAIATWTAADGDLRRAHSFLLDKRVTKCRFLVDPSFRTRKPEFCETLVSLFGDDAIRTIPLHGKFAVIRNAGWSVAIRSSMNLNPNKRIESVEISADAALTDFLFEFVDEVHNRSAASNFASQSRAQMSTQDRETQLAF